MSMEVFMQMSKLGSLSLKCYGIFIKLSGISFGIELTRQYNQPNRQAIIDGHEAELTNNERNIGWIVFKPAIILRTPDLWLNTCDDMHLWLQTSAGISLACPFSNSLTYEIREFNGNMGTTIAYREFKNNGLIGFIGIVDLILTFPLTDSF